MRNLILFLILLISVGCSDSAPNNSPKSLPRPITANETPRRFYDPPNSNNTAPGSANKSSAAPTPKPIATATPTETFTEGTLVVGTEVAPGTYRATPSAGSGCYWARLKGFSGELNDILANGNSDKGSVIVTIKPTDKGFESQRCGTWSRIK